MEGRHNAPTENSGSSPAAHRPSQSEDGRRPWRWGLAALAVAIVLGGIAIVVTARLSGDPVEREVERIMDQVRREERAQHPLFGFINEIKELIFSSSGLNSNRPNPHEELSRIGGRAEPFLIRLVKADGSPAVRLLAIEVLATEGSTNAFAPLVGAMESDSSAGVRSAAATGLGQVDPVAAGPVLIGRLDAENAVEVRRAIIRALAELRLAAAFSPLARILESESELEIRGAAAEALGQLGDLRAAPLLRPLLGANDLRLLTPVVEALAELRDREAVPQLIALLNSAATNDHPNLPEPAAARAGGLSLSSWEYASLRRAIVEALGRIGDDRATDVLLNVLTGLTDSDAILNVVAALAAIRDPKAVPALRRLVIDQPQHATRVIDALAGIDAASALREVMALLDSPSREVRVAAAVALAKRGESVATTHLLDALANGEKADSRRNVVEALGIVGGGAAVPALIEAMGDPDDDVRTQAAWALGNLGDQRGQAPLLRALADAEFAVRFAAAFSLAGLTNTPNASVVQALEPLLEDNERRVVTAAACSLAFHGSERSISQLATALRRNDDWQRFAAVVSLIRLGTPEARALVQTAVNDRNDGVRRLAAEAMERGPVAGLVQILKTGSNDHRHYAARLLFYFDDPSAKPALQQALVDPRNDVRVAARVALIRLDRRSARKAGE